MLTLSDLRKVAFRSARDMGNVEIDVILTHLLQLFSDRGITDHVAFKGGTMLRKMVFGPRGRLSTDLDFTCRTDIEVDDLMMMMLEAVNEPYHGLSFRFDKDKDWYLMAVRPMCGIPKCPANLLNGLSSNLLDFSECALIDNANRLDFDSAIPRFESWRPSQIMH